MDDRGPCARRPDPRRGRRYGERILGSARALRRRLGRGGNAGGQRTWIAPEAGPCGFFFRGGRWAVPPSLDPGDYRPSPAATGWMSFRSSLTAQAADGRQHPIAITRRMRLEAPPGAPDALRIRFQHELANTGASVIRNRIGLWSIIQLPCEERGIVLFRLTPGAAGAAAIPRPYFTGLPPDVLRGAGTAPLLEVNGGRKHKVGIPASVSAGTVAFLRRTRRPPRSFPAKVRMWKSRSLLPARTGPASTRSLSESWALTRASRVPFSLRRSPRPATPSAPSSRFPGRSTWKERCTAAQAADRRSRSPQAARGTGCCSRP